MGERGTRISNRLSQVSLPRLGERTTRIVRRVFGVAVYLGGLAVVAGSVAALATYVAIARDLPDLRTLDDYRPALVSAVYDRNGHLIDEFYEERRRLVELGEVPELVIDAFVASEDDAFFEHRGLDYVSILRAALVDLWHGSWEQGGSTITQQTVKTLLLNPERRIERKLKEVLLALQLEKRFSKREILYLYLNQIYFGSGAYGIREAARTYFGKELTELDASEAALLAGLPAAPSRYSPFRNPSTAERRRRYVLARLAELGKLDRAAYQAALDSPPTLVAAKPREAASVASWYTEEVRRMLFEHLPRDAILRGGLRIETALDLDLQRSARRSLREGLEDLDRRQGWQGPLRRIDPGDLTAEIDRLTAQWDPPQAHGDPEAARAALRARPPPLPGIVVAVGEKSARVALGLGLEGTVAYRDVKWARPRDPGLRLPPPKRIDRIFSVGDVANFALVEGEREGRGEGEGGEEAPALRLRLFQEPEVEGALVAIDFAKGEVVALVGGYDFARSQFDRAVQAVRQPGSAFKPIVYAAALREGYTPVTILHDRPVVYSDPSSGFEWRPKNYNRRFLGPIPLREAFARSVNNATIHLLRDIGVQSAIAMSRRLGIVSPLEHNLSLALGSNPVSPLELTRAYAVFPNGGRLPGATLIRRVYSRDGELLLQNVSLLETPQGPPAHAPDPRAASDAGDGAPAPPAPAPEPAASDDAPAPDRVIEPGLAYVAVDLLRGTIQDRGGTGQRARALNLPVGGKTGTTNEQRDAWFVGFSADLAAGVWVGFDESQVLGPGETGSQAALPVWMDFMRDAHADRPRREFPLPPGITFALVDRKTGKRVTDRGPDAYFQAFRRGKEPTESHSEILSAIEEREVQRLDF